MNQGVVPLVVAIVFFANPAMAALSQTPKAFVTALYADYARPDAPGPLADGNLARIFSPRLSAAIHADQTRHPGDVGKLDHDPICDCQDSDGLHLDQVAIPVVTPHSATAVATFHLGQTTRTVQLVLIHSPIGWQIDDVSDASLPSLRRFLATP